MIIQEIKKSIFNKQMLFVTLFSVIMVICHSVYVYNYITTAFEINTTDYYYYFDAGLEVSFLQAWIGGEPFSVYNNMFYYILFPLYAAIPYAAYAKKEKELGYSKCLLVKLGRNKYLISKYIACFLSGGIAVSIPAVLSLMGALSWLPVIPVNIVAAQTGVNNFSLWSYYFFNKPLLYAFMYIGLDFVAGGLLACVSLSLTHLVRSRFILLVLPMIANAFVVNLLNYVKYPFSRLLYIVPYVYVNPTCLLDVDIYDVTISIALLFVLSFGLWFGMGQKRDYLE